MKKWVVIAGYFTKEHVEKRDWLGGTASNERHEVSLRARSTPLKSWHERRTKFTPPNQWFLHWRHASAALRSDCDGVITLFQHLPAIIGLKKLLRGPDKPVVAWMFSVPNTDVGPVRTWLVRTAMRRVEKIVVHSTMELELYSDYDA